MSDDDAPPPAPDPTPPHLDTGVYSVDALTEEERIAFESALERDDALAEEALSLQATAAQLGLAAAATAPPGLRDHVLAEVDRTRQDPAATDHTVTGAAPTDLSEQRRLRRAVRVLGAAAAVLAVVAVTLGVYAGTLRQDNTALAGVNAQVAQVLTAPDARAATTSLQGQGGRGAVVVSEQLGTAVFVAEDLQPVPEGSTYQLWYMDAEGGAVSAGTFTPGSGALTTVTLDGSPAGAAAVGLTVEPTGGSPEPTTAPVMAVPLA